MNRPTLHTAAELETPLSISYDVALEALQQGEVKDELGLMRWGSNYTFLVTVLHGDLQFLAVYKPRVGERPLWDFLDGTLCQRETASYVLSEALGWHIVPPTLLREGPRGIGSVQIFIEHDPNKHYFTFDESHHDQLQRIALFDVLVNNADRKGGHCLIDTEERIWGIDQGLTFNTMPKLRTVIWDFAGEEIPAAMMQDLQALCSHLDQADSAVSTDLRELLDDSEMKALRSRLNRLIAAGSFPMPGPGPNRPWPAV